MKRSLSVLTLVLLSAGVLFAAPGQIRRANGADRIPNEYIVVLQNVLRPAVPTVAAALVTQYGGRLRRTMNSAATAFSAEMSEQQALGLTYDPRVLLVEENRRVYVSASQPLPANGLIWGLDRLDQRFSALAPDGTYRDLVYNYCEQAGDVVVYVADTGINIAEEAVRRLPEWLIETKLTVPHRHGILNWIRPVSQVLGGSSPSEESQRMTHVGNASPVNRA